MHVSAKTVMEAMVNPVAVQYKESLPDTLYAFVHYKVAAGVGDAIRQTAEDAEADVVGLVLNTPIKTMAPATHQGAGLAYDVMWQEVHVKQLQMSLSLCYQKGNCSYGKSYTRADISGSHSWSACYINSCSYSVNG